MKKKLVVFAIAVLIGVAVFTNKKSGYINNIYFSDITDKGEVEQVLLSSIRPVFADNELDDKFVSYELDFTKYDSLTWYDRFVGEPIYVGVSASVDIDAVKEYNKTAKQSESAYIVKNENEFAVVSEVYGERIDVYELESRLSRQETEIELSDIIIKPLVLEDELLDVVSKLNSYATWSVEYESGIKISSCVDYINYKNGDISLDSEWIREVIEDSLSSLQTVGVEREFKTSSGDVIIVSGGTWGSRVDYDAEYEYLKNCFENGQSIVSRVPEYEVYREDIGDTYVEVSIEEQKLWYHKDGVLVFDTPVVTGTYGRYDTPSGVYFMSECINGKYLTGDTYKTWVNKWMRLTNSGIGLHDAGWRSSFGGSIYKGNGSHGCVNIPPKYASLLFTDSYVGMPVIIY